MKHVIHLLISRLQFIMFSWRIFWDWIGNKKKRTGSAHRQILISVIQKCPVGALVQVKFIDPSETGMADPGNRLSKRYDPDDYKTHILKGTLLSKKNMLGIDYIEMCVVKVSPILGHYERSYTIMFDEIEDFRILAS